MKEESFKVFYLTFRTNCGELQGIVRWKWEDWVLKVQEAYYGLITSESSVKNMLIDCFIFM